MKRFLLIVIVLVFATGFCLAESPGILDVGPIAGMFLQRNDEWEANTIFFGVQQEVGGYIGDVMFDFQGDAALSSSRFTTIKVDGDSYEAEFTFLTGQASLGYRCGSEEKYFTPFVGIKENFLLVDVLDESVRFKGYSVPFGVKFTNTLKEKSTEGFLETTGRRDFWVEGLIPLGQYLTDDVQNLLLERDGYGLRSVVKVIRYHKNLNTIFFSSAEATYYWYTGDARDLDEKKDVEVSREAVLSFMLSLGIGLSY